MYRNDQRINVRSAGMSSKSNHELSDEDILWANVILVMEQGYKKRIAEHFRHLELPRIESLDIPDEYQYMDDELVGLIRTAVEYQIQQIIKR